MKKLLECDGKRFACKINGTEVIGRITVEEGKVYLCQNEKYGADCKNKRGYKYSWGVEDGHPAQLSLNRVTDFRLYPFTRSEFDSYKDWQVGDQMTDGSASLEVIFRSGKLVICEDSEGHATGNYTCDELYADGFRLVPEDVEDYSPVEITLEEIAAFMGMDAGQIRIVDKAVNG